MFSNDLVCDILDFIDNNLDIKISIEDISLKFFYNRFYIMKLFKKEIGLPISVYINYRKIYKSTKLIRGNSYSMMLVGLSCGYYSLEYFSEMFKKVLGVSPLKYKKYCLNRFALSNNDLDIILDNTIKLDILIEKVNRYKNNRKPKVFPVKKRSIFG